MIHLALPDVIHYGTQLVMAAVLGGIIGVEREIHGQVAGFRTYILIAISACLMMQLSQNLETLYRHLNADSTVRIDPGRIASYAIASMGFLGAGAIIRLRNTVRGLTTASGLWLVTGVGLAVGCGFYVPAGLTVAIAVITLYALRIFKPQLLKDTFTILSFRVDEESFSFSDVEMIFSKHKNSKIDFVNLKRDLVNHKGHYHLRITTKGDEWRDLMEAVQDLPGVIEVGWEEQGIS